MSSTDRLESAEWLSLSEGESIEWMGRPSLFTIAPQVIAGAGVGVGGAVVVLLLGSAFVLPAIVHLLPLSAALAVIGVAVLQWYRIRYVITSSEVYIKRGLVSLDVDQIRLRRIQNTTLSQSLLERLLGYGDVIAYTAGSDTLNIEFRSVPNPSRVNETLSTLLSESPSEPATV